MLEVIVAGSLDKLLLGTSLEVIGVSGSLDISLLIASLTLRLLPGPESIVVTTAEHVFFGGGFSTELDLADQG